MVFRMLLVGLFLWPPFSMFAEEKPRRGRCFMEDVYAGTALKNVDRGTIKTLRIVAVEPKPDSGTVAISLEGTEFPKRVVGDVPVDDDGSALFEIPLGTPLLFQTLDEKGRAIQTMRKTTTLTAETTTCIGCHATDGCVVAKPFDAGNRKIRKPIPLIDPRFAFSYPDLIQPIWDKHCVSCHNGDIMPDGPETPVMSLLPNPAVHRKTKTEFSESYLNIVDRDDVFLVDWIGPKTTPPIRKPYSSGSLLSDLMIHLDPDHYEVELTELEKKLVACWIDLGIPFKAKTSSK